MPLKLFSGPRTSLTYYSLWWVDLGQQLRPHPVADSLPPGRMEKRIGRAKARELMSWDKSSLISEGNKKKTSDAKALTHRLPPSDPCSVSLWAMAIFKEFSFYCWAQHLILWNIPLVGQGPLTQLCPLPTSCQPQTYSLQGQWETKKVLMLCKHSSAITKTWMCNQHSRIQQCSSSWRNLTPSRPNTFT